MLSLEEHLDNLIRHIDLVRNACILLGKRLIKQDKVDLGRMLIARGFKHDNSKFYGIEWSYLHAGNDIPKENLEFAISQHVATNDHHPEFHSGIENMSEICLCEMVCDWYARSQEFGTGLRDWIDEVALAKFAIKKNSKTHKNIMKYVNLLLEDSFVKK